MLCAAGTPKAGAAYLCLLRQPRTRRRQPRWPRQPRCSSPSPEYSILGLATARPCRGGQRLLQHRASNLAGAPAGHIPIPDSHVTRSARKKITCHLCRDTCLKMHCLWHLLSERLLHAGMCAVRAHVPEVVYSFRRLEQHGTPTTWPRSVKSTTAPARRSSGPATPPGRPRIDLAPTRQRSAHPPFLGGAWFSICVCPVRALRLQPQGLSLG
jgi:hypothetical protein